MVKEVLNTLTKWFLSVSTIKSCTLARHVCNYNATLLGNAVIEKVFVLHYRTRYTV
jgi:hypothetical protein